MNSCHSIFDALGGLAILIAIVTFVCRQLVINWLARDLETYKANLEKSTQEHRIQFQQIYSQRAQALSELHKCVNNAVKFGFESLKPNNEADPKIALEAVRAVADKISEYEIYLPRNVSEKWRGILNDVMISLIEVPTARSLRTNDWASDQVNLSKKVSSCVEQLQKLNGEIADDFRCLIGVTG